CAREGFSGGWSGHEYFEFW
nr:immunoglobulin heavy chain junction region [Macaca mulatta]